MKILVDANIFFAVILNEPERQSIVEITTDSELLSPEILPYEIGNALTAMFKRDRLNPNQIKTAFEIFEKIPVRLLNVQIDNAIEIATKYKIYAYDAYYLEVAQRLNLKLLTLDSRMKEVAKKMDISILEVL